MSEAPALEELEQQIPLGVEKKEKWKAYPEYKGSGIDWFDSLPTSWRIGKIKYHSYLKARVGWHGLKISELTDQGPFAITGTEFKDGKVDWDTCRHFTQERYDQDPYIQLQNGDLLITKDGTIGKLALVQDLPGPAALNTGVFVVRPLKESFTNEFLFWVLSSECFKEFINLNNAGSTIIHLYQETFDRFVFALPSLPEQKTIAAFLDHYTTKIDTLIEKKKKLIELLKEKRMALISHAVTKGLDPDAPMKDSGVEWLGEIPEGWEVLPLRRVVEKFVDYRGKTPKKSDSGVPLITAGAIKEGVIDHDLAPEFIPAGDYDEWMVRGLPALGDVVLTTEAPLGEVAEVIDPSVAFAQRVILFKLKSSKAISSYLVLFYLSQPAQRELASRASGSTASGIRADRLKASLIVVPPINLQSLISQELGPQLDDLAKASKTISGSVSILSEYRTALISAAVTGKIDVRDWEPPK